LQGLLRFHRPGNIYAYSVVLLINHSLLAGRVFVSSEIGAITACVFYIVFKLSSRRDWACGAMLFWFGTGAILQ
jgi:hypothetical protein